MSKNHQFEVVHAALVWLAENQMKQPDLDCLAKRTGYSPGHIQRVFVEWSGISPKQFLQLLTRNAAIQRLKSGATALETALEVGLSSPGRLHDLLITMDALTPGQVRKQASGVTLNYGFGPTPFGIALLAWTRRGICFLGFCQEFGREAALLELKEKWPGANLSEDSPKATEKLETVFIGSSKQPVAIWLRGSPFQLKVWQALLAIPHGALASYGDIAKSLGKKDASRAVGSAIGANPISWIIPCHRVIRQIGDLGGYRWGSATKSAIIGIEGSQKLSSSFLCRQIS